jgi:hypothetical protein
MILEFKLYNILICETEEIDSVDYHSYTSEDDLGNDIAVIIVTSNWKQEWQSPIRQ